MNPTLLALAMVGSLGGLSGVVALIRSRAQNNVDKARVGETIVHTTRELIDAVRQEMAQLRDSTTREIKALNHKVSYLEGKLEAAESERDTLRRIEQVLRTENAELRARIAELDRHIAALTGELAAVAKLDLPRTPPIK